MQLLPLCLLPPLRLCLLLEAGGEGRRRWGKQLPTFTLPSPNGDACCLGTEMVKPPRNPFLASRVSPASQVPSSHAPRELPSLISPQITLLPPNHSPPRSPAPVSGRSPTAPLPAPGPCSPPSHPGALRLTFSGSEGFLTICIVKP